MSRVESRELGRQTKTPVTAANRYMFGLMVLCCILMFVDKTVAVHSHSSLANNHYYLHWPTCHRKIDKEGWV